MSSNLRYRRARHGARPGLSALWSFWLRALLAIIAGFGAPSAFAAACTINWNATPAGQTTYTITSADPVVRACDPLLDDGLYSTPGGSTTPVVASDGSQLMADLSAGTGNYFLIFTPSASTTLTNWSFEMYTADQGLITINITRQVGVPMVSSVSPASGPTVGGNSVTINGTNFVQGTQVFFDGMLATSVVVDSRTRITAVVPGHAAGAVLVQVLNDGGASAGSNLYTYVAPPTVTGVSPNQGPTAGGNTVTISGSNFVAGATTVNFGSTPATGVSVSSASTLTAVVPAGAAGAVDVTVTTSAGTSATGASDQYTYVAPPTLSGASPVSGPTAGGTSVTLTGTNFTPESTVSFGGTAGTSVVFNSAMSLTVTTPAHAAGAANIIVTTAGGTATLLGGFTFRPPPTISSVSPSEGPVTGNTAVTISGTGFTGATAVRFGATAAAFSVSNDMSITATSPGGSAGVVDVTVTGPGGTSSTGVVDRFTYISPPSAASIYLSNVPFNSAAVPVPIDLSNHITAVAVSAPASHGTALATGTTLTYTPTPGYSGTDSFTYTMSNPAGTSTPGTVTVTVLQSTFAYAPSAPAGGTVGVAYSTTSLASASGGSGSYSYVVVSGALPSGLMLDSDGTLHGTPTATQTVSFSVKASDTVTTTNPPVTSSSLTMTIGTPTITLTPAVLPDATAAVAYSQTIQASGGKAPYAYSLAGTLPAGLTWDPGTATISGTPTQTSTGSPVFVTAKDANNYTGTIPLTVRVIAPNLDIVTGSLANGTLGVPYSQVIVVSGANAGFQVAVTGLPNGLQFTQGGNGGTIAGTPTAAGPFPVTIELKDVGTTGTGAPFTRTSTLPLNVNAGAMAVAPSTLPTPVIDRAYSRTITASGGVAPYRYAVTAGVLPEGLALDPVSGRLSGTPTATGTSTFTITATDSSTGPGTPLAAFQSYSFDIAGQVASAPAVRTQTFSNAPVTFSATANAVGGPFTRIAISTPPSSGTAEIDGEDIVYTPTPGTLGEVTFAYTLTNAFSTSAPIPVTVTVRAVPMTMAPSTLPTPVAGQAYEQAIMVSGGLAPYRYAVTAGALPAGLVLDQASGTLSGTPASTGTSTFTITATDSSTGPGTPLAVSQGYSFDITGQVASAPAVQAQTFSNAPVTFRATANAVGGPFTRVAISTPPSSGTAVVNGEDIVYTPTPGTDGEVTFAYTLTNAIGTSVPIPVTVTVRAVPVAAAALEMSVASNGTADFDITAGATGGPFTGASIVSISPADAGTATIIGASAAPAAAGVMRAAAAMGNAYTLRFVPAAAFAGVAAIRYTVSNANATSAPGTVKVTVAPRKDPTTAPDVAGLVGAQVEAARRFATTQIGNYNQRLEMLHGNGRAPSSNGLNVALPSPGRGGGRDLARCQAIVGVADRDACLRGDVAPVGSARTSGSKNSDVRDGADVATADVSSLPGEDGNSDQRFAYWTAGTVDFGFADTGAQRSGFKFTTGGVTMGADYRFSDWFSLGAGFGYGHDSTDIGNSGTHSTGDSYSGALYASYRPLPTLFVDAVAGFGTLNFDSRRWVVDTNQFARGQRDGRQFFGSLSAGYEYRADDWLFSPYGRLTASRSTLDQYSETGAGLDALAYFRQKANTLSGTLGMRAGLAKAMRIGTFSPYLRVELQHDFNGQSLAGLAYADIASSGPLYFVPGSPYGSDRVQVGAGSKLHTGAFVFGLDYSVTTGMGGLQQGLQLTCTAPF